MFRHGKSLEEKKQKKNGKISREGEGRGQWREERESIDIEDQKTIVKRNDNNNNSCLKYFWKLLFLKRIIEDGQEKHKL
jgi:hypothetical protein